MSFDKALAEVLFRVLLATFLFICPFCFFIYFTRTTNTCVGFLLLVIVLVTFYFFCDTIEVGGNVKL